MSTETITVQELARWLVTHGFSTSISAPSVFRDITEEQEVRKEALRKKLIGDDPGPGLTRITSDEIRAALFRLGYNNLTARLVKDIREHREPEWKGGDVVRTGGLGKGKVVVRRPDGRWFRTEDGVVFSDSDVRRPLEVLWKEP